MNRPPGRPLSRKSVERRDEDAPLNDVVPVRRRGIVVNWLDRLVERRMEKVERDIARVRKMTGGSGTN